MIILIMQLMLLFVAINASICEILSILVECLYLCVQNLLYILSIRLDRVFHEEVQ